MEGCLYFGGLGRVSGGGDDNNIFPNVPEGLWLHVNYMQVLVVSREEANCSFVGWCFCFNVECNFILFNFSSLDHRCC